MARPRDERTPAARVASRSIWSRPGPPVSAWCWGQEAVDDKSNEIVAIPLLLERLELMGALVTIDAMGTQTDIAEKIVGRGGDYLLALKANRPVLHRDVVTSSTIRQPTCWSLRTTPPTPITAVSSSAAMWSPTRSTGYRRYADEPRFPHLTMIGMVQTRVDRNGTVARERRYYLSSAKLEAKTFAEVVRAHWGAENRLHWVLDVVFHDDLARLRSRKGRKTWPSSNTWP
jgi:predicted transposase YbfD/YdcC